ncbi:MAG: histidine kinase [Firmicutes bacterium HGW-Firmicutes-7]|nr:MAG: histidine kinase [Firmicutes bacterium HGW-Firmicutes-7]
MLRELCNKYTDLEDEDIIKLESISKVLPIIADLVRADIFIDCMTSDSNAAIVVAEAKPSTNTSMYQYSVVGELAYRKNEPAALRTLEIGMATRDLKAITQENKTVRQNVVPIHNDGSNVIGVLIMEQDITKSEKQNKKMEFLAETAEQLTETLLNVKDSEYTVTYHINDAIVMFDQQGIGIYGNPGARKLYEDLGYRDSIIGMNFENLVLDGSFFDKLLEEPSLTVSEVTVGKLTLQIKYAALKQKNKTIGLTMLMKDITEVREKEKEIILKSVAIREIHHRVKNNLQTIASLLRLQSRRINNDLVNKAFNVSINRILGIAVTHELLAQNGVDDVDLKTIVTKIKKSTVKYSLPSMKNIIISIEGDSLTVNSDKATSIALVVNELLQNSIEHAFDEKSEGYIDIWIQKGSLYSSISIIDNGKGFDVKSIKVDSLGLNIVRSIVKDKLHGHLNIYSNESGTKIIFDFKNE